MSYLGEDFAKLGFGLMRLPEFEKEGEKVIDIDQMEEMTDLFLDAGFTYFDTAYVYHGGRSEQAIKEVLVDRYPRENYQLATKLPAWAAKSADKAKEMFFTSLERTGAGFFDFYLLHNIGQKRTLAFEELGMWDFITEKKREGLISHIGFSFHDKAEALRKVLIAHPETEFVQLQINYADWDDPVVESKKCFEVAQEFGKPVIIMEPVRGGSLAKLPESVASVLRDADDKASEASWAIRYAASLPNIVTVLSGMSTVEQMRDNISFMKNFEPLNNAEKKTIERAQQALAALPRVPCTDCRYCIEGCPSEVHISAIFKSYNIYLIYGDLERAKGDYQWDAARGPASLCVECGNCEEVCPQQIPIIEELKKAALVFEG